MTVEERVIVAVEDGWVRFGLPDSDEVLFGRTTETHKMMTGRAPKVGDVYPERVQRGLDGALTHYYHAENPPKETT